LTIDAVERDSPVFVTNGAGVATTMSLVSVGRWFGAFSGLEEVNGLVRSVCGAAGWFSGLLDIGLTTRSLSWAAADTVIINKNSGQTDRYEIFFKIFKTCSS
jgi:hypothetical protein